MDINSSFRHGGNLNILQICQFDTVEGVFFGFFFVVVLFFFVFCTMWFFCCFVLFSLFYFVVLNQIKQKVDVGIACLDSINQIPVKEFYNVVTGRNLSAFTSCHDVD